MPDVRILAYDTNSDIVYPEIECGILHRNIMELQHFTNYFYSTRFFEFMIWVDESGFEATQHATINIDTTGLINLLSQNVAPLWNLPYDSVRLRTFKMSFIADYGDYGQLCRPIYGYSYQADWETSYPASFPYPYDGLEPWPNGRSLVAPLWDPPCPPAMDSVKIYRLLVSMYFGILDGVAISENQDHINTPYPNPTTAMLYGLCTAQKRLYTMQGQELKAFKEEQLDLSPYPKGIYLLYQQEQMHRILKY